MSRDHVEAEARFWAAADAIRAMAWRFGRAAREIGPEDATQVGLAGAWAAARSGAGAGLGPERATPLLVGAARRTLIAEYRKGRRLRRSAPVVPLGPALAGLACRREPDPALAAELSIDLGPPPILAPGHRPAAFDVRALDAICREHPGWDTGRVRREYERRTGRPLADKRAVWVRLRVMNGLPVPARASRRGRAELGNGRAAG